MTSVKTAAFSFLLLAMSIVGASAATIQTYTIRAEGSFASLEYSGLYSYDRASSSFQSYNNIAFADAGSTDLNGHYLSDVLRATSGSAQVLYDGGTDPLRGNATITDCTGFLTFLCTGATQIFDVAAQSLSSFTVNANLTTLSATGLVHQSDRLVDWTAGTTSFFNSGGVETVGFNISAIDIAPVPLPAGLALLLGGLALLAGVKTMTKRG